MRDRMCALVIVLAVASASGIVTTRGAEAGGLYFPVTGGSADEHVTLMASA